MKSGTRIKILLKVKIFFGFESIISISNFFRGPTTLQSGRGHPFGFFGWRSIGRNCSLITVSPIYSNTFFKKDLGLARICQSGLLGIFYVNKKMLEIRVF